MVNFWTVPYALVNNGMMPPNEDRAYQQILKEKEKLMNGNNNRNRKRRRGRRRWMVNDIMVNDNIVELRIQFLEYSFLSS